MRRLGQWRNKFGTSISRDRLQRAARMAKVEAKDIGEAARGRK
jgi:hypothetical protein